MKKISVILIPIICLIFCFSFTCHQTSKYSIDARIGRLLFFDTRLSVNNTKSCGTCHQPQLAFTDGVALPLGAFGDTVIHNTPTLINLKDNETFNWANESLETLQAQSNFPLFGKHPVEMGMDSLNNESLQFVFSDSKYLPLLQQKNMSSINWKMVKDLIASYVQTLTFYNSKYDLYLKQKAQFSSDELAGKKLFFSDKLNCKKCHGDTDFDIPEFTRMNHYQNVGLYCVGKDSMYGNGDNGLYNLNNDKDDIGKFKIPSLRNVMLTAPYFHDGSAKTIDDVIDNYARGGRLIKQGKNAGDGKLHPNRNQFVAGFTITQKERKQLKAFLRTLTDTSYLKNEFYHNPFTK